MLAMDFHAHLFPGNEINGLLAGTFDSAARVVTIKAAYPVRGSATGVTVEMDPEDQFMQAEQVLVHLACSAEWCCVTFVIGKFPKWFFPSCNLF